MILDISTHFENVSCSCCSNFVILSLNTNSSFKFSFFLSFKVSIVNKLVSIGIKVLKGNVIDFFVLKFNACSI